MIHILADVDEMMIAEELDDEGLLDAVGNAWNKMEDVDGLIGLSRHHSVIFLLKDCRNKQRGKDNNDKYAEHWQASSV